MYKNIKKYVDLNNKYQALEDRSKLKELEKWVNQYNHVDMKISYKEMHKYSEYLSGKIWYYINYYWKLDINKQDTFNNLLELEKFINDNFHIIERIGGLELYIITESFPDTFFQLHYQNTIIKIDYINK
jgi:hypothetical protein